MIHSWLNLWLQKCGYGKMTVKLHTNFDCMWNWHYYVMFKNQLYKLKQLPLPVLKKWSHVNQLTLLLNTALSCFFRTLPTRSI